MVSKNISSLFKQKPTSFALDLLGISLGTLIAAVGYSFFLVPFKAAPGGVGSLAQIFYYTWGLKVGTGMLLLNIPLFIIGVLVLGKTFGAKTVFAIFSLSSYTNILSSEIMRQSSFLASYFIQVNEMSYSFTNERLLAVIAGSMLLGAGLGIVFRFNGSCGSTDIPALILRKYFGLSIGSGYLLIDTFIIIIAGVVFKNFDLILLGLFALFITSRTADQVIKGRTVTRSMLIISDQVDDIKSILHDKIRRGCTILNGEGGHTGKDRRVLYTIVNQHDVIQIKRLIKNIDPHAFMVINPVQEVIGEGFQAIN